MRSRKLLLAAILVCCVVGRGAHVLYLAHNHDIVTTVGDTPTYLGPAKELLHHNQFDSASPPGQPEFLRTPGYPVFIAAVYRVFGESNTALLLVQVALSALTVFLAYLLAAWMWSAPIGLLAALFTALDPVQNATASTILTESIAALLLITVATVGFAAFTQKRPRTVLWLLLGSAIAVATLIRPVTYYLPLLVVILLLVRHARRRDRWLNLAKITAALMLPLVLLLGGWQLRNHERVDSWRISGIEAKNLYLFRAAGAVARSSHHTFAATKHEMWHEFGQVGTESQGSYYGRMYKAGVHILASHPVDALVGTVNGLRSELFTVRAKSLGFLAFHPGAAMADAGVVVLVVFYAVCAYGMVVVIRRRRDLLAHAFVAGVAFYVLLASAGPEAVGARGERFRAPIVPILILYAARGAWELYTSARERTRQRNARAL
jgi:4-amino-4-deoxy-L-arabinose transferase-like glycosyltransferase